MRIAASRCRSVGSRVRGTGSNPMIIPTYKVTVGVEDEIDMGQIELFDLYVKAYSEKTFREKYPGLDGYVYRTAMVTG